MSGNCLKHSSTIDNRLYNGIFAVTILTGKLIYQRTNIKITVPKLLLLLAIIFTAASCNPTKYVPSGEILLNSNNLVVKETEQPLSSSVTKANMKSYIRQNPNKKIFGARFHLGLYNLSDINKEKWPHGWLRRIGEEPVIFDPAAASRSADQIEGFLSSKGYFNATVTDTVVIDRNEAEVFYNINPGRPYTIADIKYEILDSVLYGLVMIDTMYCTISRGMIYDVDLLQKERQRMERYIRDRGFYAFSTEDIYFRVDSSLMNHQVVVYYVVSKRSALDSQGRITYTNHKMYRIRDVLVYPDFDPRLALTGDEQYASSLDTTLYRGTYYISPPVRPLVKHEVISQALYVQRGSLYSITNADETQSHLVDLKNFRLVNVTYEDVAGVTGQKKDEGMLDCKIQLTPLQRQSFTVELEGTHSWGNLGGAVNFIYQNKSLFHGAELFDLKFKAAYEKLPKDVTGFNNTQQYGIEASLKLPKFLMPFPAKENFIRKHDPRTVIQGGYNFQQVPVYGRSVANLTLGYSWSGNPYNKYTFNPLSFDVVKLHYVDKEFQARIDTTSYLAYSYRDVRIVGGHYDYLFNNQMIQKSKDYWMLRISFDAAGNLLSLGYNIANAGKAQDGSYHLFKQPFAQFLKGEMDASYHYRINEVSSIVYRVFTGIGIPYGNSMTMPFEEQYFGGGANDIRAWMVRTLGPGSYVLNKTSFINQTADIKLEANAEYRFKLFWIIEGALFADAGNIWTIREDPDRPGSVFKFNTFIDEIAIGTGTGLRFDIKFLLIRADLGFKIRDPQATGGTKWLPLTGKYNLGDNTTFVFGIGYPF
jgi:outer membrane protein assembly factor BamA